MDLEVSGGVAGGAVSFLLLRLDAFVRREWNLQGNIESAVQELGRELRSIEALLINASSTMEDDTDHQFTVWIQDIRDQAHVIEDVLDQFYLHEDSRLRSFKVRYHMDSSIQAIKRSLHNIQQIRERYNTIPAVTRINLAAGDGQCADHHVRAAPLYLHDEDILGFDEPRKELVSWALEPKQRLEVMFVVGMAGAGKTTLARTVYRRVKHSFDRHVWIAASKSKTKLDILTVLAEKFGCTPITQRERADVNALTGKIHRLLLKQTSVVVVLDDMWVKEVWESVKLAFPDRNNGSRIIITTSRGDIANSCRHGDSIRTYKLQPLPGESAGQLFCKNAFPRDWVCPPGLQELFQSILRKCDGLPVGIIEIGRFLSNKPPTVNEWKTLHESLQSELRSGRGLSDVVKVLSASYRYLPYRLKSCFLYMSIFPENNPVKRRRLVRLWIAEGFVLVKSGKTLEEVGEEYLQELIDRNLIKATELDFDGFPKTVGVHSLMLKMILSLAHEENFCTVVCPKAPIKDLDKNIRLRRLSIQTQGISEASQDLSYIRSFFNFTIDPPGFIGSKFELLKVLDIQNTNLEEFPSGITDLRLLRYLSLRNTKIRSIPSGLSKLRHLETLDLKHTLVTEVPEEVLKLKKLRHLLVYSYDMSKNLPPFDMVKGFEAPRRTMGELENLQSLSFVKASVKCIVRRKLRMIEGLDKLTQLRKLGIVELAQEDGLILCHSIEKMKNLHSLSVQSVRVEVPLELEAMTEPPILLRRLYLKGRLQKLPSWISSLHDLVRIRLKWSSLAENPIPALQDLRHLVELQLLDAYTGTQLQFKSGKFLQLKILDLQQLRQLRSIVMEEGTLPCLQKLIISHCNNLVDIPKGIDEVHDLQELLLYDMPDLFVTRLRESGRLGRPIPCIHSYKKGQFEDLS